MLTTVYQLLLDCFLLEDFASVKKCTKSSVRDFRNRDWGNVCVLAYKKQDECHGTMKVMGGMRHAQDKQDVFQRDSFYSESEKLNPYTERDGWGLQEQRINVKESCLTCNVLYTDINSDRKCNCLQCHSIKILTVN